MSNSQLNKLKLAIKSGTEVTLKISSNVVGDSNDEKNVPHELLLRLRKAFANGLSVNIKLSKFQLPKIGQLLDLKAGLSLIENALKPLAKSVLIPLGLTAAASATDAAIHIKMFGSGVTNN